MRKRFNVTGICIPEKDYMVDTGSRIQDIIDNLIEEGQYFTINCARQYGKTTMLYQLEKKLKEKYIVLSLSLEAADEYFKSPIALAEGLIMDIGDCLHQLEISADVIREWNQPVSERFPMRDLGMKITTLCSQCSREIVLIIDEVNKNSDNYIFLSFLRLLQVKYLNQRVGKDSTFKSVILAGVYDIKNFKFKLNPGEESKYNTLWNVAADFKIDMSFSAKDIEGMLREYEKDYHTGMNIPEMSQQIYEYTSGYPYLVSRLCKFLDEEVSRTEEYSGKSKAWTQSGFQYAVKLLLYDSNILFDDMKKKISKYPELSQMIHMMLFTGKTIAYNPDYTAIDIGIMFGFIKQVNDQVVVSNRIFETRLYNYFLSEEMVQSDIYEAALQSRNQFIHDGMLDMDLVLKKFVVHFTNIYGNSSDKFIEENGRRLFLLYLKPIMNGTGNYYIESRTRNMGRTDVVVDYLGKQYVIEMKIYHGNEYNLKGDNHLLGYLDDCHLKKGYRLRFNFNKNKKIGVHEISRDGKVIVEAIV